MKRKFLYIGKCIKIGLVLLAISTNSYAQEHDKYSYQDSISISKEFLIEIKPLIFPQRSSYGQDNSQLTNIMLPFDLIINTSSLNKDGRPIFYNKTSPLFQGEYNVSGKLKQFRHGALVGSGAQVNLINLGQVNYVNFAYQHRFNNKLGMSVGVNTTKFSGLRFTNQSFGVSGLLSYKPQDKLTFHTFGTYTVSTFPGMTTDQYGASMSFDITDRFGTEIGVQRYYDPIIRRWETVPIVTPYYKFNKVTVGMDFGGIIKEVVRDLIK